MLHSSVGSPHKECLQKAIMSIDICTGLLEMKESVNKAKAYQQALQKYVQVNNTPFKISKNLHQFIFMHGITHTVNLE